MKVHFEPYLCVSGLSHKSVLISWGGFYFKFRQEDGPWKLLDDSDLDTVHPPRRSSIGARSDVYGHARVEEAYRKVIDACREHGKIPGMGGVIDHALMEKYIGMGMRFILSGNDTGFLMVGAKIRSDFLHGLKVTRT